jgi:hypothetical protein
VFPVPSEQKVTFLLRLMVHLIASIHCAPCTRVRPGPCGRGVTSDVVLLQECFVTWQGHILDGLQTMQARGRLRSDADTEAVAESIMAALQGGLLLTKVHRTSRPLAQRLTWPSSMSGTCPTDLSALPVVESGGPAPGLRADGGSTLSRGRVRSGSCGPPLAVDVLRRYLGSGLLSALTRGPSASTTRSSAAISVWTSSSDRWLVKWRSMAAR